MRLLDRLRGRRAALRQLFLYKYDDPEAAGTAGGVTSRTKDGAFLSTDGATYEADS
jgi:hypothetical protein